MQYFCKTKEAFADLTGADCYCRTEILTDWIGQIPSNKYYVRFSGIHHRENVPVILSVYIGAAYMQDANENSLRLGAMTSAANFVKDALSEKTWIDDVMITSGEGFSITDTEVRRVP